MDFVTILLTPTQSLEKPMRFRIVQLMTSLFLMTPLYLFAAGGVVEGPNQIAPDRYVYYPGTEVLAEDEIRIIACGTGMPDQRMAQASACFLFDWATATNSSSILVRDQCAISHH